MSIIQINNSDTLKIPERFAAVVQLRAGYSRSQPGEFQGFTGSAEEPRGLQLSHGLWTQSASLILGVWRRVPGSCTALCVWLGVWGTGDPQALILPLCVQHFWFCSEKHGNFLITSKFFPLFLGL